MRNEPTQVTFEDFADELLEENQPRAAVILAASKIDNLLLQTLEHHFEPKASGPKEADELLGGENPLSAFSARIKICRRLGIIDPDLAKEFDRLRQIRNQAAHWVRFSVRESPLRDQFLALRTTVIRRKSYALSVRRFFQEEPCSELERVKAVLLTLCVLAASVAEYSSQSSKKRTPRKID